MSAKFASWKTCKKQTNKQRQNKRQKKVSVKLTAGMYFAFPQVWTLENYRSTDTNVSKKKTKNKNKNKKTVSPSF